MKIFLLPILLLIFCSEAYAPPSNTDSERRVNRRIELFNQRIDAIINAGNANGLFRVFSDSNLNSPHMFRDASRPDAGYSNSQYSGDSNLSLGTDTFEGCFEPRLIDDVCPYCQPQVVRVGICILCASLPNHGYTWEAWIPEAVVEVNEFGISAINPVQFARPDLSHEQLRQGLASFQSEYEGLAASTLGDNTGQQPFSDWQGNSATVGDDGSFAEAHVFTSAAQCNAAALKPRGSGAILPLCRSPSFTYGSFVGVLPCFTPLVFNGYQFNPLSFFDTLNEPQDTVIGFTEEQTAMKYWRIDDKISDLMDPKHPYIQTKARPSGFNDTGYIRNACNCWRRAVFPEKFADQSQYINQDGCVGFNVGDFAVGRNLCSADEVGDIYPATGYIEPGVKPLVASSILARRALEVFSFAGVGSGGRNLIFTQDRDHPQGASLDKLQILAPRAKASRCFNSTEIAEWNDELFPEPTFPISETPHLEDRSVRFMYWNKKRFCSCQVAGPQPVNLPLVSAAMALVGGSMSTVQSPRGSQIYANRNSFIPSLDNDCEHANGDCREWKREGELGSLSDPWAAQAVGVFRGMGEGGSCSAG